ncbi:MAG: recombination mediator RecR [Victivallaceae bacterium]|nr:recombination mediator RecR [Victivallaceae bacterium]
MDISYPDPVEELIEAFKRFPGVGRRSAERMALALLAQPPENLDALGTLIAGLPETVGRCPVCGNLTCGGEHCTICSQPGRNTAQICVVEDIAQLHVIEKSGAFRGLYHVLGGKISPLENRTADDLNVAELAKRLAEGGVDELILALGSDVESRATAFFLADKFAGSVSKITVPAQGLPAGANLSFADSATLTLALARRHPLD